MATESQKAPDTEQVKLAAEAYIYGYALVDNVDSFAAYVAGTSWPMKSPWNQFGHGRELAGPETKFVSPNNDTCYSIAACDVRGEPLVLHVPDTAGRYYVNQFIDAWSNNFAYVGLRGTGTAEGEYLLVEPGYKGDLPKGLQVIHAPTGLFLILGRLQVNGKADMPAVHALQDQFTLTPLSVRNGGAAKAPAGTPTPDPRVGKDLEWWEKFRIALQAFPPPRADAPLLKLCGQLGLTQADSPYVDMDSNQAAVLIQGAKSGQAKVDELMRNVHATPEGWQSALHLFDYNLDYFEIGTINSPEWKIADRNKAYVTRAICARGGLWGNNGYEADYALTWVDGDGDPLDGSKRYELHFEKVPPVDAFWSLTMYRPPEFYLVANPIDRYSIGSATAGVQFAKDGSVTSYLQKDSPGSDKESNWLPCPEGPYRPILRMYAPRKEILQGTYVIPGIKKVT